MTVNQGWYYLTNLLPAQTGVLASTTSSMTVHTHYLMSAPDKALIEAGHLTYLTLLRKENSALQQQAANQK